jgi:perosamine synthetase
MKPWKVPLYKIYFDQDDVEATTKVVKRGSSWAIGPEIEEFERAIAEYVGKKYAVSFNSGTSALHAIMHACKIGSGDKVVTPSFTFIATANAPLFTGATPLFADIEQERFGLDVESVLTKLNSEVKAVMPVHYGGMACRDIQLLRDLTEERNILLVEDAAESLGSAINGVKAGSFGDLAMFSFCGNKVITTGEGGMVVTDSWPMVEKLKLVRSHGRLESEAYFQTAKTLDYIELGYNWRMSSITAALGLSQLKKLEKVISMRQERAAYLSNNLKKVKWIKVPEHSKKIKHVYQMYTIQVTAGRKVRDALRYFLTENGVMTKVYFEPVHLTHFYRKRFNHREGELPITEKVSDEVLTLPIYPAMTKEEMDYLIKCIMEFAERTYPVD